MKGGIHQSTGSTLTTLISGVTEMVTAAVGWVTSYATEITSQPILLIGVITGFVGMGVGLIKRMIRI